MSPSNSFLHRIHVLNSSQGVSVLIQTGWIAFSFVCLFFSFQDEYLRNILAIPFYLRVFLLLFYLFLHWTAFSNWHSYLIEAFFTFKDANSCTCLFIPLSMSARNTEIALSMTRLIQVKLQSLVYDHDESHSNSLFQQEYWSNHFRVTF